jgi:hypothetical protein
MPLELILCVNPGFLQSKDTATINKIHGRKSAAFKFRQTFALGSSMLDVHLLRSP